MNMTKSTGIGLILNASCTISYITLDKLSASYPQFPHL